MRPAFRNDRRAVAVRQYNYMEHMCDDSSRAERAKSSSGCEFGDDGGL